MSRLLIAIVLIVNLLACPLRCYACQVAGAPDAVRAETPCGCCLNAADNERSLPDNDEVPQQDCDCPSCICEGATTQQPTKLSDVESFISHHRLSVLSEDLSTSLTLLLHHRQLRQSNRCRSGRDALVAHQAWLI